MSFKKEATPWPAVIFFFECFPLPWPNIFEAFFLLFRIGPWSQKIARAITKEKKLYFYDYAALSDAGAKFENMVALELYRAISNWNDLGLGEYNLHYIRNKEKEEVDFLISNKNKPFLLIEAKLSDPTPTKSLIKFQTRLHIPAIQLVNTPGVYRLIPNGKQNILVATASRWLSALP